MSRYIKRWAFPFAGRKLESGTDPVGRGTIRGGSVDRRDVPHIPQVYVISTPHRRVPSRSLYSGYPPSAPPNSNNPCRLIQFVRISGYAHRCMHKCSSWNISHICSSRNIKPFSPHSPKIRPPVTPVTQTSGRSLKCPPTPPMKTEARIKKSPASRPEAQQKCPARSPRPCCVTPFHF